MLTPEQVYDMAVNDMECIWDDPEHFVTLNDMLSAYIGVIDNAIEECHAACKEEYAEYMKLRTEQIP